MPSIAMRPKNNDVLRIRGLRNSLGCFSHVKILIYITLHY